MTTRPSIIGLAVGAVLTAMLGGWAKSSMDAYFHPQQAAANQPPAVVSIPIVGEMRDGWQYISGDPSKRENWQRVIERPVIGEVRQGYRYLGGDPALRENWELVQPWDEARRAGQKPCYRLDIEGNVIGLCEPKPKPPCRKMDLAGNVTDNC